MKFKYTSKTKTGTKTEGIIEATNRFEVARKIRENSEVPITIEAQGGGILSKLSSITLFGSVSLEEKIVFTKNLSGMLTAGLSLYRALEVLRKQSQNKNFQSILDSLLAEIDKGGTLSTGMEKFPKVFPKILVSMVHAGEESGGLPQTLKEVGQTLEKSYALTRKIKGAMIYPGVILSLVVVVGILMFIFVVPTITKIFKDLKVDLPASTKAIIWFSDTVSAHPILIFAALFGIVGIFVYLLTIPRVARWVDYITIRLPVIGTIAQEMNAARTTRTLSSLLSSGVEITQAFTITQDVLQNFYYKEMIGKVIIEVQKGSPMSELFKQHTELYPVMVGEMIEVGEETGKLSAMLADIATFYEQEVDEKTKDLSTIIEPLLMIFIGGAVGFFAVSMLTPMYKLMDSIK